MNLKLGEALLTLQNAKNTDIPEYAQEQLQAVKEELKGLNQELKKVNEEIKNGQTSSPELQPFRKAKMAILFDQIYRLKRFLLIYHNFRCDRIEDQFWNFGGNLNNQQTGHLSESERNYFTNYKALVMNYTEQADLALTIDLEPPLETQVEVRMLQDCGELLTNDGLVFKLEKNTTFLMHRKLIEPYVRQGLAIIVGKK